MLSKNKIKHIQALSRKKKRDETGLYIAEGQRLIDQLIAYNCNIDTIIVSPLLIKKYNGKAIEIIEAEADQLKKISQLKSPSEVIAICRQTATNLDNTDHSSNLVLALDDVQDPGNLGTIIRLASWFGIKHIVCSVNSVDCYNAKVVQSTMGAIAKVAIHYTNLEHFLENINPSKTGIYGTFLEGNNIYETKLAPNGIIILGNEGNGISGNIARLVKQKLLIPAFDNSQTHVESLNVSMAAGIVCSEFRRRTTVKT